MARLPVENSIILRVTRANFRAVIMQSNEILQEKQAALFILSAHCLKNNESSERAYPAICFLLQAQEKCCQIIFRAFLESRNPSFYFYWQ